MSRDEDSTPRMREVIGSESCFRRLTVRLVTAVGRERISSFAGVLGANVANNLASFAATLFVARQLGTDLFARIGIGLSIVVVGAIVCDLGLSIALVRQYPNSSAEERRSLAAGVILLKFLVLAVLIVSSGRMTQHIVAWIPMMIGHETLLRWSIVSAGLLSVWNSMRSIEQARSAFSSYRNWTVGYGFVRVCVFVTLVVVFPLSTDTLIVGLYGIPLAVLCALYLVSSARSQTGGTRALIRPLGSALRYGAWITVSGISFSVLSRMPQFALAAQGSERQVGLFSAALTFLAVLIMFNQSVRTLLLPDVAALRDASARLRFRRRARSLISPYASGSFGLVVLLTLVQVLGLGGDYAEGIVPFVVMAIATVVTIYFGLLNTLIHSHGRPQLDAVMNIARCIVLGGLIAVIPMNSLAAALAYSFVLVAGEVSVFAMVRRLDAASVEDYGATES